MAKEITYLTGKIMAQQEQDKEFQDSENGGFVVMVVTVNTMVVLKMTRRRLYPNNSWHPFLELVRE